MGAFKKSWKYVILIKAGEHVSDGGSCCEKVSEFLMVRFSYNQTKR